MKGLPASLFLVTFTCGAWRVKTSFAKAIEESKFGGAVCCAKASPEKPHGASITEYSRTAVTTAPPLRPIIDLEKSRKKVAGKRGGLVVIDGGKSRA